MNDQTQTKNKPKALLFFGISISFILSLIVLFIMYGSTTANKTIRITLVSGLASIDSGKGKLELNSEGDFNLNKFDSFELGKNSKIAMFFDNGDLKTLNGPISVTFIDSVREGNQIKYVLKNLKTNEVLEIKQNISITETTAMILGFNDAQNFKKGNTNLAGVLGASTKVVSDKEEEEKYKAFYHCIAENKLTENFDYSEGAKYCLQSAGLKSN
jgi:hypothetical protein